MSTPQAPADPIFWVHHAQMDRLWSAWVAAGNGRQMPPRTDAYWQGSLTYDVNLTLPLSQVYDTKSALNYMYADESMPTAIAPAPAAQAARIMQVAMLATQEETLPHRPAAGNFTTTRPKRLGTDRKSLGGVKDLNLDAHPVSARIAVEARDGRVLQTMLDSLSSSPFSDAPAASRSKPAENVFQSVHVVLDDVCLTARGEQGGYFYDVYLNLPQGVDRHSATPDKCLLGGFGAFEIQSAQHHAHAGHPRMLKFPATRALQAAQKKSLTELTVSFICTRSDDMPRETLVQIAELRIELSTGEPE
jgi:tyrosinase